MDIKTTLGISRKVTELYSPKSIDELKSRFLELRKKHQNISFVSRGHNWGYGCNAPNNDDSLLITLDQCNQIRDYNEYHGTITVEPGVTYSQLANFLRSKGSLWIAPVHGGGPDCSVLGNCMERGYGITPHTDHFGAVLSLTAILNNGEIYEGALKKLGQEKLDKLFRYGIGPYFDGVFTQSGLGIVTEVTIKLAHKPPYLEMFYFNIFDEADLPKAVEAIKKTKRELGSNVGGINLINTERCLSMVLDYPLDKVKAGEPLSQAEIDNYAKRFQLTPWLVVGMLYGEKDVVRASKKSIKKNFGGIRKRSFAYNTSNQFIFKALAKTLTFFGMLEIPKLLKTLEDAYAILQGEPNKVALRLAYWKNENKKLVLQETLNPTRDHCGLIWYAPLVEMKGDSVVNYVKFIREASKKFSINPLITLTTIDDLCFDSTIPILFNQNNEKDKKNARDYYQYLMTEGARLGFFPYRLSIESQKDFKIQSPLMTIAPINSDRYK